MIERYFSVISNEANQKYCDYPVGKRITPFQEVDGDNYFMETGENFTYLGSYEEIGNITDPWEERSKLMQGGHVLNIFKRHSLIDRGRVVFNTLNNKFLLH